MDVVYNKQHSGLELLQDLEAYVLMFSLSAAKSDNIVNNISEDAYAYDYMESLLRIGEVVFAFAPSLAPGRLNVIEGYSILIIRQIRGHLFDVSTARVAEAKMDVSNPSKMVRFLVGVVQACDDFLAEVGRK